MFETIARLKPNNNLEIFQPSAVIGFDSLGERINANSKVLIVRPASDTAAGLIEVANLKGYVGLLEYKAQFPNTFTCVVRDDDGYEGLGSLLEKAFNVEEVAGQGINMIGDIYSRLPLAVCQDEMVVECDGNTKDFKLGVPFNIEYNNQVYIVIIWRNNGKWFIASSQHVSCELLNYQGKRAEKADVCKTLSNKYPWFNKDEDPTYANQLLKNGASYFRLATEDGAISKVELSTLKELYGFVPKLEELNEAEVLFLLLDNYCSFLEVAYALEQVGKDLATYLVKYTGENQNRKQGQQKLIRKALEEYASKFGELYNPDEKNIIGLQVNKDTNFYQKSQHRFNLAVQLLTEIEHGQQWRVGKFEDLILKHGGDADLMLPRLMSFKAYDFNVPSVYFNLSSPDVGGQSRAFFKSRRKWLFRYEYESGSDVWLNLRKHMLRTIYSSMLRAAKNGIGLEALQEQDSWLDSQSIQIAPLIGKMGLMRLFALPWREMFWHEKMHGFTKLQKNVSLQARDGVDVRVEGVNQQIVWSAHIEEAIIELSRATYFNLEGECSIPYNSNKQKITDWLEQNAITYPDGVTKLIKMLNLLRGEITDNFTEYSSKLGLSEASQVDKYLIDSMMLSYRCSNVVSFDSFYNTNHKTLQQLVDMTKILDSNSIYEYLRDSAVSEKASAQKQKRVDMAEGSIDNTIPPERILQQLEKLVE